MTVRAIVALWLSEPEVPFTVTVTFPSVAVAEAVNVRVEVTLPLAAGVTGLEENAAVTPVGRPVALRVVGELKLSSLVILIVLVPLPPRFTLTEAGEALIVKFGDEVALTVRVRVVVATRLPEVPVMVTVLVPVVADALAVSVSALVPLVGFGLNAAVTPVGSPDAASVTLPVKPFRSFTVIVLLPPAPPSAIVKLLGESERVKLGVAAPVSVLISVAPFGVPHPVTRS